MDALVFSYSNGPNRRTMILYYAIREGLTSQPVMIPADKQPFHSVTDQTKDWYSSLYQYSELQVKQIQEKKSVAGIRDTITNRLYFDFDSTPDEVGLLKAQADALALAKRLFEAGIDPELIKACFSGSKGFSIEVLIDKYLTPDQFKALVRVLARDLSTFDKVVSDANRIIRIPLTKHQKSGLYKTPLTLEELEFATIDEIKGLAATPRKWLQDGRRAVFPATWEIIISKALKPVSTVKVTQGTPINWAEKPSSWRNCKWSLLQGHFEPQKRHEALIRLAATCKGMGFDKKTTYYMCKSALKKQAEIYEQDEFPTDELWLNIIEGSVFSDTWQGGSYSCKTDDWLKDYCSKLGEHCCPSDNHLTVKTAEVFGFFDDYARNYEKNALSTGIGPLDDETRLMVGTSNALLAPPGAGKTSVSLQILNHLSHKGIKSIFFSYDMFQAALLTRMIQRHTGYTQKHIFQIWGSDNAEKLAIKQMLADEYKNVDFCFKAGQSPQEIVETIDEVEAKTGEKVKLIVVDYNELVVSDKADDTAASAQIAQKLRQIANEKQVCSLTLLQPSKVYSAPADEITNYNAAKGASSIAQSMTLMLGCARPGFNPLDSSHDKFFNMTCLKNRNGGLFSVDLGWDGLRGNFYKLSEEQEDELKMVRMRRAEATTKGKAGWE